MNDYIGFSSTLERVDGELVNGNNYPSHGSIHARLCKDVGPEY